MLYIIIGVITAIIAGIFTILTGMYGCGDMCVIFSILFCVGVILIIYGISLFFRKKN